MTGGAADIDEVKTDFHERTSVSDLVASVDDDDREHDKDGDDDESEEEEEVEEDKEEGEDDVDGNNNDDPASGDVRDSDDSVGADSDGYPADVVREDEMQEVAEEPDPESATETFEVTAYIAMCDSGCTGVTADGTELGNSITDEIGRRIVATDPSVIPLGSTVLITLSNGEQIEAVSRDTGGNINGNRIDLLVGTGEDALEFGRQTLEVEIIE